MEWIEYVRSCSFTSNNIIPQIPQKDNARGRALTPTENLSQIATFLAKNSSHTLSFFPWYGVNRDTKCRSREQWSMRPFRARDEKLQSGYLQVKVPSLLYLMGGLGRRCGHISSARHRHCCFSWVVQSTTLALSETASTWSPMGN